MQYESGEGPCLDAARLHETVRSNDLRAETRWPRFASQATGLGVVSMLSLQLFVRDDNFGALNLYAGTAGAFGWQSESDGMLLASHAALAMTAAWAQADLLTAIGSRDLIGRPRAS